jgi:hypothetical protein
MHFYRFFFCILISSLIFSCQEDEDYTEDSDFRLTFSTDTLSFDTLFTGFGSTTKQLKVKNTSGHTISISHLYLQNSESDYRLNVNGIQSNELSDLELDAKDSLYIFVEVDLTAMNEDAARLLEDHLYFEVNGNVQEVVLAAFAQDVYLVEEDIKESTVWTGNRPYLCTDSIWIEEGVDLVLQEGTKVFFTKNASLHVKGNLEVDGSFQQPVYFGSSRLEEVYENVPGQWDGIYFYEESRENFLSHFILEDGINGLKMLKTTFDEDLLNLEYGIIRNFTSKALFVANVNLIAHDLLIRNCGEECMRLEGEGDFEITHSTCYNAWYYSVRSNPILFYQGSDDSELHISNSIIWGSKTNELYIGSLAASAVSYSLLKLSPSNQEAYLSILQNSLVNSDPDFFDLEELDYHLGSDSPAINSGDIESMSSFSLDLDGNSRDVDSAPDMGCYEFVEAN